MTLIAVALLMMWQQNSVTFPRSPLTRQVGWNCTVGKDGRPMLETCKPNMEEEFDVPAIQETRKLSESDDPVVREKCRLANTPEWGDVKTAAATRIACRSSAKFWTCADKERILEHSESGKYWCRKVQN
jgi:hypothetical protein